MIPKPRASLLQVSVLLGVALFLSACVGGNGASSWPGLTSDGSLAFVAFNEAIYAVDLQDGDLSWKYPAQTERGRIFYAAPAVSADGLVLVGDFVNQITALDASNGSAVWGPIQLSIPTQRIIGAPTVAGELVLVPSSDGRLYARHLADGKEAWTFPDAASKPLTHALWSAPVVSEDRVFLAGLDHNLYVLDLDTGELLWNDPPNLGGAVADSPVLTNDLILVGTFANELRALDADRGGMQWSFQSPDWVWGAPAVGDGIAYFGDLSGILHAVAVDDGNEIWNVALGSSISASPVYHQDRIYIVTEGGLLIAREASTNSELWQKSIQGQLLSDPLLIGEILLVASSSGEPLLSAFVAESGASRWTFSPSEGS